MVTASCKRSFSKLKLIKDYLRSTIEQEGLTNMATLFIEHTFARKMFMNKLLTNSPALKQEKHVVTI